jgi:microsomal dipeptidase-like Zn-dependent dipeptidase
VEDIEAPITRVSELRSDILEVDDSYLPGAQWVLQASPRDPERFHLKHLKTGLYLTTLGLEQGIHRAAILTLSPAQGCAEFPELTLDASGEPRSAPFDDGSLYGIAETHSHILSNFGFGGGGIFHGSAFHPLGVQHALPSCEQFHGKDGRRDLFGYGFDNGGELEQDSLLVSLVSGRTPEFNHFTDGYPTFTTWPDAGESSTHQTQYYKWMERAWMGGLRLMVQHATSNQVICDLIAGQNTQPTRYACSDMVAVDRIIEETYRMERYIDAQHGGPGKGWFRIVTSPAQAREIIAQGKLAIVLGIEASHLFDCFIVPPEGSARCTEQDVLDRLDSYWDKGVRVLFPVHKYDNEFSAGDGSRDLIEVGNFAQSGHWSNFTTDCPDVPSVFDKGNVGIGGLNMPRDDYFAQPPNDLSNFPNRPVTTLLDYVDELMGGPLEGDYCQNAGLTPLGEFLLTQMMRRGIIIELDHLPRRGYVSAFDMLEAADYPAVGSHGNNNRGKLYELGGVSKISFGRCSDPAAPGARMKSLRDRVTQIEAAGGFPAEGVGFDLNGFAGGISPRFGDQSGCTTPQENPVTYPFDSFDGGVSFTQPAVGERQIDFNTEGFVHLGMLPELIEDVRHDGATDAELEPLFKSAEAYIRMWEKSERRAKEITAANP